MSARHSRAAGNSRRCSRALVWFPHRVSADRQSASAVYDKIAGAYGRAQILHVLAFFAVALVFYLQHTEGATRSVTFCGVSDLMGSIVVWWRVSASGLIIRRIPKAFASTRWQRRVLSINGAASVMYAMGGFGAYSLASILRAVVMLTIWLFASSTTLTSPRNA